MKSGKQEVQGERVPEVHKFQSITAVDHNIFSGNFSTVRDEASQMLTVTFVRHPFHRLVSAYYDKIARNNKKLVYSIFNFICSRKLYKTIVPGYECLTN